MSDPMQVPPFVAIDGLDGLPGDVVLADVRWYLDGRSGREAYDRGHLPGAVFVDLETWLSAPPSPEGGRHPLPPPEVFAEGMRTLGIADDDTVVAYDDQGGVIAARLVWMLRASGHRAALLDGGLGAYPGDLSTQSPVRERSHFAVRDWPADLLLAADDLLRDGVIAVDARPRERFAGDEDPVDPRPGHVPGARSVPCRENVAADGRLLAADRIRENFAAVGVDANSVANVAAYCGSGVTACHNLLTMEHVGIGRARLYVGGWSAYSADPSRAVETGA